MENFEKVKMDFSWEILNEVGSANPVSESVSRQSESQAGFQAEVWESVDKTNVYSYQALGSSRGQKLQRKHTGFHHQVRFIRCKGCS